MTSNVKKAAPKGVSEEKYKRCKEKVRAKQGASVNEYAVCAAALQKSEKGYPKTAEAVGCGTGLAGKICRHNVAKLNKTPKEFAKAYKDRIPGGKADDRKPSDFDQKQLDMGIKVEMEHTDDPKKAREIAMDHLAEDPKYYSKLKTIHKEDVKKSYDFRDSKVSISAADQMAAEQTADQSLVDYLKAVMSTDLGKIPLQKGILTIHRKEKGLFSGFFQDQEGQIVEKFDDQTLEMIAKNLEIKELYQKPSDADKHPDAEQDEELIEQAMAEHHALYHRGQAPGEPISNGKTSIKVKYGNFELEIKKSISDFVKSFKQSKLIDLNKALSSWRRNSKTGAIYTSNLEAAKGLLDNWDDFQEEFNQILFVVGKNE